MTATMAITWHQGERTGTVEVSSGTKASGLKLCLNAESCPVNMQGSVDIRVRRSANPLSMKKSLGAVINDGDEEVAAHWQLFVDEPPPVVTVPVTTEVQVFTSERSKQLGVGCSARKKSAVGPEGSPESSMIPPLSLTSSAPFWNQLGRHRWRESGLPLD